MFSILPFYSVALLHYTYFMELSAFKELPDLYLFQFFSISFKKQ